MSAVFEARGVEKSFPGVKALKGVSLSLETHSIHALLGENGAGKSTLIKIITGVHRPDGGALVLDGQPVSFGNPREAIANRIGVVHQERNLIGRFSVAENIHLEQIAGFLVKPVDYAALNAQAERWLEMLGLDIDPRTPVSRLSVAQMQMVEIAKALSSRSRVLLLDEPTASLTSNETDRLFSFLKKLRDGGASLVFVSHKLEEVQEICDRVTVLRDGENACPSRSMEGMGRQDIVRLMIGRAEREAPRRAEATQRRTDAPLLRLSGVSTALGHRDIDMEVRPGEIVGFTGWSGRGARNSPIASSASPPLRPERWKWPAHPFKSRMSRKRSTNTGLAMSARTARATASFSPIRFWTMPASRSGAGLRGASAS